MKSTGIHWLIAAVVLCCTGGHSARAQSQPSFDCHKAANPTEKRICADPDLARLDRDLATHWRNMIRSFTDSEQVAEIKADQRQWIARRNQCGGESKCIAGYYRTQIDRLNGGDHDYPAAGVFEAEGTGSVAVYPHSDGYLVDIQTADPANGSWTCEVTGTAKKDGDGLLVTSGGLSFHASVRETRSLVIEQSREVNAVASKQCGLNGTFAFTFTRH